MSAKKKTSGSVHKLPPSGTDAMRSPYKGHTSVKSNAFAATGCTRLMNQYGVVDHLNVHYKKIHTAKSRIDSATPKSWTTSVKKMDQVKRQGMQKRTNSDSRPSSRSSSKASLYRPDIARSYDRDLTLQDLDLVDQLLEDDDDDDGDIYRQHQRSSLKPSRQRPNENGLNSTYGVNNNQLGYTTTGLSTSRSDSRLSGTNRPRSRMSADLLDKRAESFTTPRKEHTPRTLRTNAQSRLAQSKSYNPPKRKEMKPRCKPAEEDAYSSFSEEDIVLPQDQTGNDEHGEPRIPTSPTADETNDAVATWVTKHTTPTPHLKNTGKEFNSTLGDIQEGYVLNQSQNSYTSARNRTMEMTPRRFSRKMEEQEDELRYLEFVTDVTNDVLNRGIFTNRVLKQVFETHIQLHKQQLDEARMRDLMLQLQRDLQIPDDDEEYDSDDR